MVSPMKLSIKKLTWPHMLHTYSYLITHLFLSLIHQLDWSGNQLFLCTKTCSADAGLCTAASPEHVLFLSLGYYMFQLDYQLSVLTRICTGLNTATCHHLMFIYSHNFWTTWPLIFSCTAKNIRVFLKMSSGFDVYKAVIKSDKHPAVKASHFILQATMKYYEDKLKEKTDVADTIVQSKIDVAQGTILIQVTADSSLEWFKVNCPTSWKDHPEKLVFESLPKDEIRVKISIKMLNLGELDEEVYFNTWKTHNRNLDISSWKFLNDGCRELGDGFILLFLMVNRSSLDVLKDSSGNYSMKCGVTGRGKIRIYEKREVQNQPVKRKLGFNAPMPTTKQNGKGGSKK